METPASSLWPNPLRKDSPSFPRGSSARSLVPRASRPETATPGYAPREACGCGPRSGAGRGRPSRRRQRGPRRWRSGRGARPAGRQGEAGGRGAAPPFPRGGAGRPYCGAVCGGGGASCLRRPSARTTASPSLPQPRRRAAPSPHAGGQEPLALRVSRRRPPFPHCPLRGSAGDAEVAARSCGARTAGQWRRRQGLPRLSSHPAGQVTTVVNGWLGSPWGRREPRGPARMCPVRAKVGPQPRVSPLRGAQGQPSASPRLPRDPGTPGSRRRLWARDLGWHGPEGCSKIQTVSIGGILFCSVGKAFIRTSPPASSLKVAKIPNIISCYCCESGKSRNSLFFEWLGPSCRERAGEHYLIT
ncbi:uncharacterized protein LOC142870547 [Microcebus murinus]|uniref:uncharacterized protein LOC142870547 n=1 Tax=Microcebus murinus TaxID=30608 RepID=UPI003F6A7365